MKEFLQRVNCSIKFLRLNNKGLSITEVLVAAGLAALISLGIATMLQNSAIEQKKMMLLGTLKELKIRIETVVRDQSAWNKTVADITSNSSLACLSTAVGCDSTSASPTSPVKLILRDAGNNIVFNLLDWAGAGTNGFTEGGAKCSTFSATAGAGNDMCPISYRLVYSLTCPNGGTCKNPQFKVTARLIYNPSSSGYLHRFKPLIQQGSLTTTNEITSTNVDGKFDVAVRRTSASVNPYFKLAMAAGSVGGPAGCAAQGAGTCTTTMNLHPMNWTSSYVEDTYGLLTQPTNSGAEMQTFKFKETGFYSCNAAVTAFATLGFQAELYDVTAGVVKGSATTIAGLYSQSSAIIEAEFNVVDVTHAYAIRQKCDSAAVAQCSLGMNTASYTGRTVVVSLTCFRLDKNF